MVNALIIQDIALSRRRRSLPDPVDGHRDIWFDVTVTVENRGKTALHVIDQLRGLTYDPAQRRLTLRLCELKPGALVETAPSFTLPTPSTILLQPGATARIAIAIPAILKELQFESGPSLKQTDLRDMRMIRCEVAASPKPIGKGQMLAPHDMRSLLFKWGEIASSQVSVTPDDRDRTTAK